MQPMQNPHVEAPWNMLLTEQDDASLAARQQHISTEAYTKEVILTTVLVYLLFIWAGTYGFGWGSNP
jgi:hypothetical protein